MSKMKKVLLMCTAYVLVAALAIGGTIAYLQDDDSDVNVMTLGNVSIAQHEYERATNTDGSYETKEIDDVTSYVLKDFTQGKPLLPIVGDPNEPGDSPAYAGFDNTIVRMTQVDSYGGMQVFAGKNAQDKFVTVENTGKTDAYVRTLVAVECGSTDGSLVRNSYHSAWTENEIGVITVDGNNYYLIEYAYTGGKHLGGQHEKGILPAGETSYPSLSQVYLKHNATNEDMVAIDGNGNGTLDILVVSQAVQVAGFADAETALNAGFGDITPTNHPWAGEGNAPVIPVTVSSADDLVGELEAGENVVMNADLTVDADTSAAHSAYGDTGVTIDGNTFDGAGNTLTVDNSNTTWDCAVYLKSGTVQNVTVNGAFRGIFMGEATGDAYVDNVVIDDVCYTFNSDGGNKAYGVYISNSALNGWTSYSNVHKEVVFTNCNFGAGTGRYAYAFCRPYNASVFENCVFEKGFQFDTSKTSDITFINCYYGDTLITAENAETLTDGETPFFCTGLNGITIN